MAFQSGVEKISEKFDAERVKNQLAILQERLKNEVNPQLLDEYRSLFNKEISLFNRTNFGAFLLMLAVQGELGRGRYGSGYRSHRYNRSGGEGNNGEQRYPLAEEDSVRLFLGIGRSRRVFPREILGLITAKTDVSRDDVGAIRILDNYSFVQVRKTIADTIIEALNGKPFRGRLLSVNYARNRRDEYDSALSTESGYHHEDDDYDKSGDEGGIENDESENYTEDTDNGN
ncbi:RNA-binding protein [Spirochaetia bacterium]|nr:RNA-binding protein [Spirochaetia bacterium]